MAGAPAEAPLQSLPSDGETSEEAESTSEMSEDDAAEAAATPPPPPPQPERRQCMWTDKGGGAKGLGKGGPREARDGKGSGKGYGKGSGKGLGKGYGKGGAPARAVAAPLPPEHRAA